MAKSIKLNLIYNILLNVTNILFPIITAPYVARVLEPDGIGLYHFSNTISGYFALVACLGIPTYGIRIIGANREDFNKRNKLFNEVFTISVFSTLFFSILYLLMLFFVPKFSNHLSIFFIAGFALYTVPMKVDWYFSGMNEFGYIAARSIIIKVLSVILLFLLVHNKSDLVIYVAITAFSLTCNEIWNFIKIIKSGIKPQIVTQGIKQHLKPIIILFSSFVTVALYTSTGSMLLGFFCDYSEVGYYNIASQMGRVAIPVVTSLATVALPRISEYVSIGDKAKINTLVNKSLSFVMFLAFPLSIGLCIISKDFVPLFFGSGYDKAIVPMEILSFVIIVIGLNNLTGIQILIGLGKDRWFFTSTVISALVSTILYVLFVYLWGAVGASIVTVIAESLILLISTWFILSKTFIKFTVISDFMKTLLSSLVLLIFYPLLKNMFNGWTLITLFAIFGGIAYLLSQLFLKNSNIIIIKGILNRI